MDTLGPGDRERASPESTERRTIAGRQVARVAGYVLVLLFFGLAATSNGLKIAFRGNLTTSSPGELNFWLGHAFLLFPASLLIGYGFGPQLGAFIERVADAVRGLSARERALGVLGLALFAIVLARIGRHLVLLDFPVSDDEYAVEFGGRILASGHVMTRVALPLEALPGLFLYFRDGAVGSVDWVGGQAVSAIGLLTGLGSLVWTVLAGVPVAALAILMGRRLGPQWGLAAAILFLCSPMALLLSMTTHAHLASRAFLALALLAFWSADREGGLGRWALTGCMLGLAFLCRPLEIAFFSAPLVVWTVLQTVRRTPSYAAALPGLVVGCAPFAALFLWHSYAMTGNPLLPVRFTAQGPRDVTTSSMWTRFGDNVSYNVLMLAIWFLGPLGLALVAAGVLTDRFTKLLGTCIVADLCLAFFHDNSGLHIVGPIHYSECAVPLTIVATHGLANVLLGARRHLVDARAVSASIAVSLALGLGTFSLVHALALRDQAKIQRDLYRVIEGAARAPGSPKAVVLTPWFFAVVGAVPAMRDLGTWVHDWRRPRLDLSDDVLFLRDTPAVERALRSQFPDRRLFRLQPLDFSPFLALVPLDGGEPIRLVALSVAGR